MNPILVSANEDVQRPTSVVASILRSPDEGFQYKLADGIMMSPSDPGFIYEPWLLLPSREELRDALQKGVAGTLDRYAKNQEAKEYVRDNIYDPTRAGWQAVCPIRQDSVILDFGCGLGALSRSLARNCGTVIGADACYERLMVNSAANRELGFGNVELLCGDHTVLGHMKTGCVDGMVLNGVLEWVPEMAPGEPRDVQLRFLKECRRIVKDDGWLYIGIENRWGYRYFMDRPDEHVDLMYSTLLPRWLANIYCKIGRKKPYRTYTYSPAQYRALLKEAGFSDCSIYATLPDYRSFTEMRPLGSKQRLSGAGRCFGITTPWKQRVLETPACFDRCAPSLGIVGRSSQTVSDAVWMEDFKTLGCTLDKVYVKHDQASFWYRTNEGEIRIRELALARAARSKLRHIAEVVSALKTEDELAGSVRDWRLHEMDGWLWTDRRMVEGTALADLPDSTGDTHLDEVCQAIRRVHSLGDALDWPVYGLTQICEEYPSPQREVFDKYSWDQFRQVISTLDRRCGGQKLLMHGDCTPPNILIGGHVVLIDWEWSRVVNFPGYDVLKLLWFHDEDPRCATRFWNEEILRERLDDERARRCFRLVHPTADWKTAVLMYWCVRTARELGAAADRGWEPDWIRTRLEPSLDVICRHLDS